MQAFVDRKCGWAGKTALPRTKSSLFHSRGERYAIETAVHAELVPSCGLIDGDLVLVWVFCTVVKAWPSLLCF